MIINSTKALNSHRRHENSVTSGAFDVSQLKEIISVQKLVQEGYVLDDVSINKSETYAQRMYE